MEKEKTERLKGNGTLGGLESKWFAQKHTHFAIWRTFITRW